MPDNLAIERHCEKLSIAYARAIDFNDHAAFADLFAEDGVLNAGRELKGRDAIVKSLTRRPAELRSRHVLTNIFTEVISGTEARGISYLSLYRHIGPASLEATAIEFAGPAAVGHYDDRFVLTGDGWRFKQRQLHLAFRRADAF